MSCNCMCCLFIGNIYNHFSYKFSNNMKAVKRQLTNVLALSVSNFFAVCMIVFLDYVHFK